MSQLLTTFFGVGYLRPASGTWASALAVILAIFLHGVGGFPLLLLATLVIIPIGFVAVKNDLATRKDGVTDPSEIVIDEVAGQWLTLALAPPDPLAYGVGFALFRLFDIWKPWPVRWADRHLAGGLGVMADDILAGLYGAALMAAFVHWR